MIKKIFLFIIPILIIFSCEDEEPIPTYKLVTSVNPIEGGTVSPSSGTFDENTSVSITATPSPEYLFLGWSGSITSNGNPLSIVMNSDKSLTATFTKREYPLTITIEGEGTVNETSENYESGAKVTLTAIPNEGWYFKEWKGDVISTENPIEVIVDGPKAITVVFIKKELLSLVIEGNGIVEKRIDGELTEDTVFSEGTIIELTAVPDEGWAFKEWKGDVTSTANPVEVTVDGPKAITAFFKTTGSFSSSSLVGQWIFNEYTGSVGGGGGVAHGGDIGGDNHEGDGGCYFHSLLLEENNTFSIYSQNYPLFGTYVSDSSSNTITFYVDNEEVGVMVNAEIDSVTNNLEGTFDFPNLFGATSDCDSDDPCSGSLDSAYNENLTYVPDDIFEQYLIDQGWDDVLDDYFVTDNVKNIEYIGLTATDNGYDENGEYCSCDGDDRWSDRMKNLSGIEAFISIEHIQIVGNDIDSINLTKNTKLEKFNANFNSFKGVNTDKNLKLEYLSIDGNIPDWSEGCGEITQASDSATQLSFLNNPELEMLSVPTTGQTSIDLSNNPKITFLDIIQNYLTSIDLSNQTELRELRIQRNNLASLDLSNNPLLEWVKAEQNNLTSINLPNSSTFESLNLSMNNLNEIDLPNLPSLKHLFLPSNNLSSIDLSNLTGLIHLKVGGNKLTSIDLSNNVLLENLSIEWNELVGNIDVSMCDNLQILGINSNPNLTCIQVNEDQFSKLQAGELPEWSLGNIPYSLNCN